MSDKFGLDAELAAKAAAKYDPQMENDAIEWIEKVTKTPFPSPDFYSGLKDGVILCTLMETLRPGTVGRYTKSPKHYLEEKANINAYIASCEKLEIPSADMVTPIDFSERKKDLNQILQNIYAVGRQIQALRLDFPRLGVKYYSTVADQKRRLVKKEREKTIEREKTKEYNKKLLVRREHLEMEQIERLGVKKKNNQWKRHSRKIRRERSGRDRKLTKEDTGHGSDEEDERSPSPIRYGMDKDLKEKQEDNYDHELEDRVLDWIEDITGVESDSLYLSLKSGELLCKLISAISPGSVKKIHSSRIVMLEKENINSFLAACKDYGVADISLFRPNDLYERRDLGQVLNCIVSLERTACERGWRGPRMKEEGETGFVLPVPELFEEISHLDKDLVAEYLDTHLITSGPASGYTVKVILLLCFYIVTVFWSGSGYPNLVWDKWFVEPISGLNVTCSGGSNVTCPEALQLNTLLKAGQTSLWISFALAGVLAVSAGPRITMWVGSAFKLIGYLLLLPEIPSPSYYAGYLLVQAGGPLVLISSLSIVQRFPRVSVRIMATLVTAYFVGAGVMSFLTVYIALPLVTLRWVSIGFAASYLLLGITATFLWPKNYLPHSGSSPSARKKAPGIRSLLRQLLSLQQIFSVFTFVVIFARLMWTLFDLFTEPNTSWEKLEDILKPSPLLIIGVVGPGVTLLSVLSVFWSKLHFPRHATVSALLGMLLLESGLSLLLVLDVLPVSLRHPLDIVRVSFLALLFPVVILSWFRVFYTDFGWFQGAFALVPTSFLVSCCLVPLCLIPFLDNVPYYVTVAFLSTFAALFAAHLFIAIRNHRLRYEHVRL
eukprot:TRINITY_DN9319_c0_g1_i1.p1 TRINITY_DN9319_c0_g1~~TRINITY_DN9319_c0_g1_i1.p1  ORF type:complete len:833 (-),score=114.58 TRINITY_DN9319_c0_g1_i1:178-2676(-)